MQSDFPNSTGPNEVASMGLFGELVCAGEIRTGEEERAETVTGVLVRCSAHEIRRQATLPMYQPVVMLTLSTLHELLMERDRLRAELEKSERRWLGLVQARRIIDAGDSPNDRR